ncbi:MAG: methyltransferase domain-containing protein [Candidatus Elarobacter sp.]
MSGSDSVFAGSIPELYDRYMGPLFFEPYASDLAARARTGTARRILETAAGTGIVTRALHLALPNATIVASDLNPGMIARGAEESALPGVTWRQADALSLPFDGAEFDLVVCQFGAMFFPDQTAAFRQAQRVLVPGGRFLLSLWASLEHNEIPAIVHGAVGAAFPNDPPTFIARTPHGHGDPAVTVARLRDAGFAHVTYETVEQRGRAPSAHGPAVGLCQGTPLRNEIEARDANRLREVTDSAARALAERFGDGPIDAPMRANVFDART